MERGKTDMIFPLSSLGLSDSLFINTERILLNRILPKMLILFTFTFLLIFALRFAFGFFAFLFVFAFAFFIMILVLFTILMMVFSFAFAFSFHRCPSCRKMLTYALPIYVLISTGFGQPVPFFIFRIALLQITLPAFDN